MALNIPLYETGTLVRISNTSYIAGYPSYKLDYYKRFNYRVLSFNYINGAFIYELQEENNKHTIKVQEKGLIISPIIGHQYSSELPVMKDDTLYDIERWTPVGGGCYLNTLAIKVTKEEALEYWKKEQEESEKWRNGTNHWFPWRDGIRIVEYSPRVYIAVDHESKCPGIVYNLKEDERAISLYKVLNYASADYNKTDRIFSNEDLDRILDIRLKEKLEEISKKLTVKQQELLNKGLQKINN